MRRGQIQVALINKDLLFSVPLFSTHKFPNPNYVSMAFKFENLIAWQKSLELSLLVNQTVKSFPKEEMYVLTSLLKRAADSVSLNIAEGSTGQSNAEFNRFLGFALRSCIEVVGCIFLAKGRNLVNQEEFNAIYQSCEEVSKIISGLRNSLEAKNDKY